jgi:hypothetical protein
MSAPTNISYLPSALGVTKVAQLSTSNYWYTTGVPSVILGTGIPYTVVAWVYFNNFYNSSCFSTGGSWGENYVFALGQAGCAGPCPGGTFRGVVFPFSQSFGYLGVDQSCTANFSSSVPVYANQWVFLWWQYPGSGSTFYLGAIYGNNVSYTGTVTLSAAEDIPTTGTYFWINQICSGGCESNGWIAYLAFYNVALSGSQIYSIYQGQRITSGLVMEYRGDNYTSGTGVWIDSSGNNVNLSPGTSTYPNRGCLLWPIGNAGIYSSWPTC